MLLVTGVPYTLLAQSWKPVASILFEVFFCLVNKNCMKPLKFRTLLVFVLGLKFYMFLPGK